MRVRPALLGLGAVLSAAHGCRTPTEVTLDIRTDNIPCSALRNVQITVGPDPQAVEKRVASSFVTSSTRQCTDGYIGSLVVSRDPGAPPWW
jgi:hypothetical protein